MRQIVNLLVVFGIFVLFYTVGLPKKAKVFISRMKTMRQLVADSKEDSVKSVIEIRICEDICPTADLSEYRAQSWSEFGQADEATSSIMHAFTCDGSERKYLFRVTNGVVSEIVDLR